MPYRRKWIQLCKVLVTDSLQLFQIVVSLTFQIAHDINRMLVVEFVFYEDQNMLIKYLPVKLSKNKSFLLFGILLFIYLLDNLSTNSFIDYSFYNTILRPIIWIGLAFLVGLLPRASSRAPLRLKGRVGFWALNCAVINIAVFFLAGLIDGFGQSPYDHSLKGYLLNLFTIGTMLVGREAARAYTVNNLVKEEEFSVFIPIAIFFTLVNYPVSRYTGLKGFEGSIQFIAQFLAPELAQNLLASYLAFLGGWLPALIYMGLLQAFNWFLPVLPNLKWITAASVGILCPFFSMLAMQSVYAKATKAVKKHGKEKGGAAGWMITCVVSIVIVWFAAGVFPIYPSVIATGSMEPLIKPGDVILVEKITKMEDIDKLRVGDIVQFKRGSILISHRIIGIMENDEGKSYRTKGDNNSVPDVDLVRPQDMKGKIVSIVPKIGWPTLLIKSRKGMTPDEVEF